MGFGKWLRSVASTLLPWMDLMKTLGAKRLRSFFVAAIWISRRFRSPPEKHVFVTQAKWNLGSLLAPTITPSARRAQLLSLALQDQTVIVVLVEKSATALICPCRAAGEGLSSARAEQDESRRKLLSGATVMCLVENMTSHPESRPHSKCFAKTHTAEERRAIAASHTSI